jgi:2-amino-4-hydroxy-6-hydroxymethyldihydropteridine diphosphokinase
MTCVFVALGSNVGDRSAYIDAARQSLENLRRTRLIRFSSVYETAAAGPVVQGDFLNAVAMLETDLTAIELLVALVEIERSCDRPALAERVRWGPRTLDLDIVLFGDEVIDSDMLTVPHPLMHARRFVLEPLVELAPDVVHPVLHAMASELLAALDAVER